MHLTKIQDFVEVVISAKGTNFPVVLMESATTRRISAMERLTAKGEKTNKIVTHRITRPVITKKFSKNGE